MANGTSHNNDGSYKIPEAVFQGLIKGCSIFVIVILVAIMLSLVVGSLPGIAEYGTHFLVNNRWAPLRNMHEESISKISLTNIVSKAVSGSTITHEDLSKLFRNDYWNRGSLREEKDLYVSVTMPIVEKAQRGENISYSDLKDFSVAVSKKDYLFILSNDIVARIAGGNEIEKEDINSLLTRFPKKKQNLYHERIEALASLIESGASDSAIEEILVPLAAEMTKADINYFQTSLALVIDKLEAREKVSKKYLAPICDRFSINEKYLAPVIEMMAQGNRPSYEKATRILMIGSYGALPFIVGTLLTSLISLVFAIPFSLALSILLGEYLKNNAFLSTMFSGFIEILAGIPSIIYGFFGFFVLRKFVMLPLEEFFGVAQPNGLGIMTSALILTVMILPYSASLGREVIELVPGDLKEAGFATGATRFEVIRSVILPYASSGIIAGILLALGRAIGETMAVTMLIGGKPRVPDHLFDIGNSMASLIASTFGETLPTEITYSLLIEMGLILLVITAIINLLGKYIISRLQVQ